MTDATPAPTTVDRGPSRRVVATILIAVAGAQALGLTLKMPTQYGANDISRWSTVWSLLERRSFAIDDCPWQGLTQDKVRRPDRLDAPGPGSGTLKRLEYAIAPASWKSGGATEHLYSSKPPLLSTIIAAVVYPAWALTGRPLDAKVDQARNPRWVEKEVDGAPGTYAHVYETPPKPVVWPAYVLYLKPVVVLFNVVPYVLFLVLYARMLDRLVVDDWTWLVAMATAAWGTLLLPFVETLNNHTIAAFSAFFALDQLLKLWSSDRPSPARLAACGFWAAFCACNELPAAPFGVILFAILLMRSPRSTLAWFAPAAAIPCVAFLATQFLAFGQFTPVYEEFGTRTYRYYGSYWTTPLELDYYNEAPEPRWLYLLHMTVGHHGVFSLSPIFVVSMVGMVRLMARRRGGTAAVAWLSAALTAGMLAFYTWNPKARNYGGSTQGLRWLFWLIPFWLITLPEGLSACAGRPWARRLAAAALGASAFSVAYAMRQPWSHPWLLDLMEHLDLLTLRR